MVASNAGRSTRRWKTIVRPTVLGTSDVCHWCGHPGSNDVDHHPVPYKLLRVIAPEHLENPDYCAPIHGREGCPICPPRWSRRLRSMTRRHCNQEKGSALNATPPVAGSRPW